MRIHLVSDLHFEFQRWRRAWPLSSVDADVHVLAGDIGIGLEGIQWALTAFSKPVIYVMGNHEYYGQRPMVELLAKARQKTAGTHVHLLENESVVIDSVRFIGCTLWTDFCLFGDARQIEMMEAAGDAMTDYSAIYVHKKGIRQTNGSMFEIGMNRLTGDRMTPQTALEMHIVSRQFIELELGRQPAPETFPIPWTRTVVVTHHAPSATSLQAEETDAPLSAAYASQLDDLVARSDLWLHGHVHAIRDYRIGTDEGGRVVVNARGYKDFGSGAGNLFNPFRTIDI